MNYTQLISIFCQIDDFCKEFDTYISHYLLTDSTRNSGTRVPSCCLNNRKIMAILIGFQSSDWRHFKGFYNHFIKIYFKDAFPTLLSCQRFIEIMKRVALHLMLFSQMNTGKHTGIYYIDSTYLPTCHLKRSSQHKIFDHVAEYGRTSVGFLVLNCTW